jgi:hypothetical protein
MTSQPRLDHYAVRAQCSEFSQVSPPFLHEQQGSNAGDLFAFGFGWGEPALEPSPRDGAFGLSTMLASVSMIVVLSRLVVASDARRWPFCSSMIMLSTASVNLLPHVWDI